MDEQEKHREYHPVANLFPLLTGEKYEQLKADIDDNGLIDPIWLHPDRRIIDGRNRHRACVDLDIEPQFRTWDGSGSLLLFVFSLNLHRRHLNETQLALTAYKIANMNQGERTDLEHSPHGEKVSQDDAAKITGASLTTIGRISEVARSAPDLMSAMDAGTLTARAAQKIVRARQIRTERAELAESTADIEQDDRWCISVGDIQTWQPNKQYDFIITDPPYPKEYLDLYEVLAIKSNDWLKDGGLLVAMCGQSYLSQIYEMMSKHLVYYWTAAYLLPKQPTPLRQRQVNTSWKPILIYAKSEKYKGKIFGDVYVSDANDKDFHKWGQSVSGMFSLISQICLPGQTILDPFCGAGTTGVAALQHGCLFDGIDLDEENVGISTRRLYDTKAQA